jgi:hypothetical protein
MRLGFQEAINESSAGNFGFGEVRRNRQRCDDFGGDVAGFSFQRFRQLQCDVAGVIAVLSLLGPFKDYFSNWNTRRDGREGASE